MENTRDINFKEVVQQKFTGMKIYTAQYGNHILMNRYFFHLLLSAWGPLRKKALGRWLSLIASRKQNFCRSSFRRKMDFLFHHCPTVHLPARSSIKSIISFLVGFNFHQVFLFFYSNLWLPMINEVWDYYSKYNIR